MKIAKKLNNIIIFGGEDKEFNEFIERIKKEKIKLVPVQLPKVIGDIDSSYINNKWNSNNIENSIFYGKNRDTAILAYADNEKNKWVINDIIAKRKVNVRTSKFTPYSTDGDLYTKVYMDGVIIEETIERLPIKKFNIVKCLK